MKKNLLTVLAAVALSSAVAQAPFLTKTCYRGAFAPAPTPMWTDNWTEWDPQNKVYPAATMTVNANITTNTTWSTGQTVLLQGPIYVTNNSILTIQPGVVIRGSLAVAGSGLFITTGSKLMAVGNSTAPIVFTSDAAPGSRAPGDWGGVILMGLANNNNPGGTNYIEGIATSTLTQYGGGTTPNDNDNSGDLEYVRIEFGGYVYAANKEINGLTFGAVGRGTVIDNIQCSFINDDAFEWFGGTVNCKHLVAYRCVDDNFDTDNGFSGNVQFCLGVRDANLADPTYAAPSGASTSEGFESDNDASGTTTAPLTSAIFSNVTDIGPLRGVLTATCHPGFRRGARIRRNSSLKIVNSIFMDHKTRGLFVDGQLSEQNAQAGSLIFQNNILAGYGQRATEQGTFNVINTNTFVAANFNDTLLTTTGILTTPYNYTSPDYRPAVGSPALTNASFTNATIAAATISSTLSCSTGIKEIQKQIGLVTLAPNPSTDATNLTINSNYNTTASIYVYDVTGKLVKTIATQVEISVGDNSFTVNSSDLNAGVYFVTINTTLSKETVKLIVTK